MTDQQPRGRRYRRPHNKDKRTHRVVFYLTEPEYTAMDAAAEHARLANGAFIARALHNAITGRERPEFSLLRELIIEVAKLADQLRRIGVNLNQVVAVLHTTGHMPESLPAHAAAAAAAFHKVDELADTRKPPGPPCPQ